MKPRDPDNFSGVIRDVENDSDKSETAKSKHNGVEVTNIFHRDLRVLLTVKSFNPELARRPPKWLSG